MSLNVAIRLLEPDANRRGDLFGRLMEDLFIALGYQRPRVNIHKSGREIDIDADHRLEPRTAIAECKATANTIGGDDINKFAGALDVERGEKRTVTGYFISLSGFKETALEQEKSRPQKIILLDGPQIADELIKGRILIGKERATELAGRCVATLPQLVIDAELDLFAHAKGWIWSVYYTQGKIRTHFVLIHSDGTPLARAIAEEIVSADSACGGELKSLKCANPQPQSGDDADPRVVNALEAYRQYLTSECGFIHLDGMPADTEVGSRKMTLESLFVPLNLDLDVEKEEGSKSKRRPVGKVLESQNRLAILAAPGGGKSTLLKRIAVAYSDRSRLEKSDDGLPSREWLPLFFRCRDLRALARGSFADLLAALADREPVRQHSAPFLSYIDRALLAGRVLLLVDGLDEIPDPGDRAAFVCTIRSALQAYPSVGLVVTSREAGFRHVAAHLAGLCTKAVLSPLNRADIRRLCVAWHVEVLGDTEKVRSDARKLAETIAENDRISRLTVNPLLLTTLLLVKRWIGSLPTRRAVLYGKAVEVLLMTWNTEGHEPIPEDEALPQLCYVASSMMSQAVERISRPQLARTLQEARATLQTELGYVRNTVEEFIHRVEDRSSLLMMTGIDVEDGKLVEFFEFRHLTFQEFLTARGLVEGWHPGRAETDTLVTVLSPHLNDEKWREVIPLAAVLGGKKAEPLIKLLTEVVGSLKPLDDAPEEPNRDFALLSLASCLADEAAARPETVKAAIHQLVQHGSRLHHRTDALLIFRNRYGVELIEETERAFMAMNPQNINPADALLMLVQDEFLDIDDNAKFLRSAELLISDDRLIKCKGAVGIGSFGVRLDSEEKNAIQDVMVQVLDELGKMVLKSDLQEELVASYALANLDIEWEDPLRHVEIFKKLVTLWRTSGNTALRRHAARAIGKQRILKRDVALSFAEIAGDNIRSLFERFEELEHYSEQPAAVVVAWYTKLLDEREILERVRNYVDGWKKAHSGEDHLIGATSKILVRLLQVVPDIDKPINN